MVIMLSVVNFIYVIFVGQLGSLLTGLPGSDYLFAIGNFVIISYSFLEFKGRRWRFFLYVSIFAMLSSVTSFGGGVPFDVLRITPIIINSFFADLILNSFFIFFKSRKPEYFWVLFINIWIAGFSPPVHILIYSIFYSSEVVSLYITVVISIFPIIIIEAVAGAFLGASIFRRTKGI